MSYRHTLEAALESLQDIEELIKGFPDNGDVPGIELDLSLQKLRNIYELLLILKKPADIPADLSAVTPGTGISAPAAAPVPPVPVHAAPVPASGPVPAAAPVPTPVPEPVREPVVEIRIEKEVTETFRVSEPAVVPPRQTTLGHKDPEEARILSDRFKGRTTLHETFHHSSLGKEGTMHSQGKPVENLMSAIAINDRFTFIRELFNGDSPAFEQAIKVLNEATNFNDAYNYMIQHYDWDMDSDAVQLLLDIIRRKYIISRHE